MHDQERQAAAADTSGWAGGIKAKQKENHALQLELHGKLVNGLEGKLIINCLCL